MDYPRVTEVLRTYIDYTNVPPQILKNAAERGTTVHALCAGIAKGSWIPDSMIEESLQGYITSFKLWSEAQVKEFLITEKRYVDDDLMYSGQVDYVITGTDGRSYLVDLKTSARPQKTYPLQVAAYNSLLHCHGINVDGAMLVYLNKAGEFPEISVLNDMTEELHIFQSALDCWHYFHKGRRPRGRKKKAE